MAVIMTKNVNAQKTMSIHPIVVGQRFGDAEFNGGKETPESHCARFQTPLMRLAVIMSVREVEGPMRLPFTSGNSSSPVKTPAGAHFLPNTEIGSNDGEST